MSDPFEEHLQALRPSSLPGELKDRLACPPEVATFRFGRLLAFVLPLAAAVCIALALSRPGRVSEAAPVLVGTRSQEVTRVLPLSVITDGENRPWEFVEVSWVEESTLASSGSPVTMRIRDVRRAVVPTPVYFD